MYMKGFSHQKQQQPTQLNTPHRLVFLFTFPLYSPPVLIPPFYNHMDTKMLFIFSWECLKIHRILMMIHMMVFILEDSIRQSLVGQFMNVYLEHNFDFISICRFDPQELDSSQHIRHCEENYCKLLL